MLWLNGKTAAKEEIFRYILWVNKKFCDPPLSYKEVLESFDHNWLKYRRGEMDFSKCMVTKHSFWSPKCTLSANEKRKITCSLYYKPLFEENTKKIYDAIEDLFSAGEKITQQKVV